MMNWTKTRITTSIDFEQEGKQIGDMRLPYSSNEQPLGYYPIPAAVFKQGEGPTLLLTGGVHGDEYEGPAALMQFIHEFDLQALRGRVIILPALNAPAFFATTRCSPLDGGNLNRAFPGDTEGGPTAQIADLIEKTLMPESDAAIDFHAGGKASVFAPVSMLNPSEDGLGHRNLALAEAFGAPYIWIMNALNDDRTLNGSAERNQVPMFAVELGGAGKVDPDLVQLASDGILRVMAHLGMLEERIEIPPLPSVEPNYIEVSSASSKLYSSRLGLFVPAVQVGNRVVKEQLAGTIYSVIEPERTPEQLFFENDGVVISLTNRGVVGRGELLVMVGSNRNAELD